MPNEMQTIGEGVGLGFKAAFDEKAAKRKGESHKRHTEQSTYQYVRVVAKSLVDLDTEGKPVFSGDGPCPQCGTPLRFDWKFSHDFMQCPACEYTFDADKAIEIAESHQPNKSIGSSDTIREIFAHKRTLMQHAETAESFAVPDTGIVSRLTNLLGGIFDLKWAMDGKRKCPYCMRMISLFANKCPECHEWL